MDPRERALSLESLMRQATVTADTYLFAAIEAVEKRMGEGAAERFPQIVAAFVQAAAQDYLAGVVASRMVPAFEDVADAVRDAGDAVKAGLSE